MPTEPPPDYNAATTAPAMQLTNPQGATMNPANDTANQHGVQKPNQLERMESNVSSLPSEDGLTVDDGLDEEGRRSFDDEHRDLPEGWVRCFDSK